MPIAAVPAYLGSDFSSASPGLRFGMYLTLWGVNSRSKAKLWATYDENYRPAGPKKEERLFKDENKSQALGASTELTADDVRRMKAIAERQGALRSTVRDEALLYLPATAIAPFATGLGNEHPLENGFAFLNPYGLPYLPGSGVKGVLRQAGRDLASGTWGERHDWSEELLYELRLDGGKVLSLSMLDVLFGRETESGDTQHLRGALAFWDVIPQIPGNKLYLEVMTPHQTHYYQNGQAPHDSGQPNPILFLTVPPESAFAFHVVCNLPALRRLAPALEADSKWKQLLQAAFRHAFDWLGFGAKTAVGYGALKLGGGSVGGTPDASPPATTVEVWKNARLTWSPGPQELKASAAGKTTAPIRGKDAARGLFAAAERFDQLERKKELSGQTVEVEISGRLIVIKKVL